MREEREPIGRRAAEERHCREQHAVAAEQRYHRTRASAYQAMWLLR